MNADTHETVPTQTPKQLLKQLQVQFAVLRDCAPLAIGIDKQILKQLPDTDRKLLRVALAMHTNSTPYLKQTKRGEVRMNLDGSPAEPLREEHRARAADLLRERQKKVAEQHKAAREAAQASERLNEKLGKLAEKFAKSAR
jgi:ProP effector